MVQCKHMVIQKNNKGRYFIRPCGQCLQCRINDVRSWFVRSMFEIKKPERPFHYFITLTYDDEFLPKDGLCDKSHLKKFLNNLNTSFDLHLRYFATADYGTLNNRAHYHAILLSQKKITYDMINRIWKKGFVYIKDAAVHNIKYTLRYTIKKKPIIGNTESFFRLISKGWGDNCAKYYTGQDYFIFDGKEYGIPLYCKQKIGLDKEPVVTYSDVRNLLHAPDFKYTRESEQDYNNFINELTFARRRLK